MKKLLLSIFALCAVVMSASAAKIYVNPGHGSWTSECRNMTLVNIPSYGDTLGFWESNTNLWKSLYLEKKLKDAGHTVKMSRRYSGGTGQLESSPYDKALHVIAAEANSWGPNYFISVHSNAAGSITVNYPMFIHRGYDNSETCSGSKWGEGILWDHHFKIFSSGMEPYSYYSATNKCIRGGLSMNGWDYGVLRHSYPGTLVEGYFHTYQPGRHRAMQPDWCRQEGLRYFRGFTQMYGSKKDTKGYIMGYVRRKDKQINQTNYSGRMGNDIYYPVNGAKIVLRDAAGNVVKTDPYKYVKRDFVSQDIYTTDNYYNGVFVYDDLAPGKYTIYVHASGCADYKAEVTVSADATTYTQVFLTAGTGTNPNTAPIDPDIKWVLNGGKVPGGTVPSNEALWSEFMTYFNSYYPGGSADNTKTFPRATQEITGTTTFWPGGVDSKSNIFTNSNSKWKWLGDYIASVASAQGYALSDETAWRWHMHAFFNCHAGTFVVGDKTIKTANFTAAGKSSAWGRSYQINSGASMELPYKVTSAYTLPTPVNGTKVFVGWFDNAAGTGTALTSIPANWKGTLYAIWREGTPDVVWNLAGGKVPGGEVPTSAELWEKFKEYYQKFYSETRADQEITAVSTFMTKGCKIMTDGTSDYKWLGDYIISVSSAQSITLGNDPSADGAEALWRWSVHSFFNCNKHTTWPVTADFATAGKQDAWKLTYQAKYGAGVTLPIFITSEYTIPTPVRDGYVFKGWNTKADGTGTVLTKLAVGYKGTVYAVWEVEKTTPVKWVLNGGTVTGTLPEEITAIYTIPTPTKAGEIFVGWYDNANGKGDKLTQLTVGYEGTIYAVWRKPSVKWELNGGQVTEEKTTVSDVKVPTQEELWSSFKTAASLTLGTLAEIKTAAEGQPHTSGDTPCACRIIAKQLDNAKMRTIYANADWKWLFTYIKSVQTTLNEDLAADTDAQAWRYAVSAFFAQTSHNSWPATADFSTAGKESAWGDAYKKAHGGTPTTEVVAVELPTTITSTYTIPTPTKEGVKFVGWYDNANGDGTALTTLPANYDGTVYAIWSDNVVRDVIWNLNGGSVAEELPGVIAEAAYTLPTPSKSGYVFVGWYDNADGKGDKLTSLPIGYKGTVYAIWREAKVTWELNGGKVVKEVTTTIPGKDVAVPTQEELWSSFKTAASLTLGTLAEIKTAAEGQPHTSGDTPCACRIIAKQLDNAKMRTIYANADWKWLFTYIKSVQTTLNEDLAADTDAQAWRYAVSAFFAQTSHNSWPATADFSTAGKPEAWGGEYQKAHGSTQTETKTEYVDVELPSKITAAYTIPTPVKDGDTFVGWYDNNEGTGVALTVLPVGYDGTVYAIWESMKTSTDVEQVARPKLDINAPMYDIMGRQVDATYRGIILQGGNKYLLR